MLKQLSQKTKIIIFSLAIIITIIGTLFYLKINKPKTLEEPQYPKINDNVVSTNQVENQTTSKGSENDNNKNLKYPSKYTYTDETETTGYKDDSKTLYHIYEYDQDTGKLTNRTDYKSNGITVDFIAKYEYDQNTGTRTKETKYQSDGKKLNLITEWNSNTGNKTKETYFADETIDYIWEYDQEIEKRTKKIVYNTIYKTIDYIWDFDKNTGFRTKSINYKNKGLYSIIEYDKETHKQIKYIKFKDDNKTIDYIEDCDPNTGKPIKTHDSNSDYVKQEQKNLNELKRTN